MLVKLYPKGIQDEQSEDHNPVFRAEVPLVAPDDRQYQVVLLDADDSFDVIVHNPDGSREIVWSLVKED
jgi:hypothetical protein